MYMMTNILLSCILLLETIKLFQLGNIVEDACWIKHHAKSIRAHMIEVALNSYRHGI